MSRRTLVGVIISAGMLILAGLLIWNWQEVLDFSRGLGYQPSQAAIEIRDSLELTDWGKRIFAATQPAIETQDSFNSHCKNEATEVMLLGCYTGGQIYVFEIKRADLADANKVTMAHELLHAAWERMTIDERSEVERLLQLVKTENPSWAESELAGYDEDKQLEEIYTRAGTKLTKIPAELEQNYARVFRNRNKIVAYYENYQAPFAALVAENEKLAEEIYRIKSEIVKEKEQYSQQAADLDAKIAEFNECAKQAGCFLNTAMFEYQRKILLDEQTALENTRTALNQKIEENNNRVTKYQENQSALGELNDAMNSNAERSIE